MWVLLAVLVVEFVFCMSLISVWIVLVVKKKKGKEEKVSVISSISSRICNSSSSVSISSICC